MQTQTKAQVAVVAAPDSRSTLVRTLLAVLATATLLFVLRPTVIHAQSTTSPHTVSAGETLWSLATRFYGDGQKWLELAKLNGLGEAAEKQLVVGQVIKVPEHKPTVVGTASPTPPPNTPRAALLRAAQPTRNVASAAPAASGSVNGSAAGVLAAQTAGKADAAAKAPSKAPSSSAHVAAPPARATVKAEPDAGHELTVSSTVTTTDADAVPASAFFAPLADPIAAGSTRIWSADIDAQRGARGVDQSTVFQTHPYDPAQTELEVQAALPVYRARERAGEYSGAPYAVAATSLASAGLVGRRSGSAGGSFRSVERLVLVDEAEVTLPAGVAPVVGARFVSVDAGELLAGGAQVVLPTGVLEIVRVEAGRPAIARVVRQSGRIQEGQYLVSLEGSGITTAVTAKPFARAATGPETEVTWVEGALLPTLQSYLMLAAGERDGVKAGDEFALVTRQGLGADAPEFRIALVRVVRVTAFGSSAIVIRQDQPTIAVGAAARLVARAP